MTKKNKGRTKDPKLGYFIHLSDPKSAEIQRSAWRPTIGDCFAFITHTDLDYKCAQIIPVLSK